MWSVAGCSSHQSKKHLWSSTKRAQVKSEANLIEDVEVSCEVHRSPRGLPRSRREVTKVLVDVDVEAASTREAFKYGSRSLNQQLSERQRSPALSKCNAGQGVCLLFEAELVERLTRLLKSVV